MHRNPTPLTWMHWNRHSSGKCAEILPLTYEFTEIITPQVRWKNRNPTPHTWMHQNRHSSGKCTKILSLTHECTEIIISQVNALESYPSHMNAPKSSLLRQMHQNPTPHTWMHRNRRSSGKCTGIIPLTYECTEIIINPVKEPESYSSHMNAPK